MKLRIRGNSLRLRVTKYEIAELVTVGFVENRVQLGFPSDCALVYRLELSETLSKAEIYYQANQIRIRLPKAEAVNWAQNQVVGIYVQESWGLKLAIEKDFKCLDPQLGEDESDAFENPSSGTSRHNCPT